MLPPTTLNTRTRHNLKVAMGINRPRDMDKDRRVDIIIKTKEDMVEPIRAITVVSKPGLPSFNSLQMPIALANKYIHLLPGLHLARMES